VGVIGPQGMPTPPTHLITSSRPCRPKYQFHISHKGVMRLIKVYCLYLYNNHNIKGTDEPTEIAKE
jgi:hypothetical protein